MHKAASIIFIILFVFSIYFQTILFVQYKENGDPNFASGNNFDCIEAVGTFNEYNYIPNYQHEKNNWSNFLKKSGCL